MKLTIEKLIYGGQGLSRIPEGSGPDSGMRAFVPFTLPGEIVETKMLQEKKGYRVGELLQVELASRFRVVPSCPWFGTCGGCQLQHAEYAYQVEMKREMLAESLTRSGIRELPEITSLSGSPFSYRNRVRLQMQMQPEFAIGYRQTKSHRMVAIEYCPVAMPVLERCIAEVRSMGLGGEVPPAAQEIEVFTNNDQSQLLMTLWIGERLPFERVACLNFWTMLQKRIPQLTGAVALRTEQRSGRLASPLAQWGRHELNYRVAGRDYTVSIRSFFQINAILLDELVHAVIAEENGCCAWDLYAGAGLFSQPLAARFQQVVAVESSPQSIRDLRKNVPSNNCTAVESDTHDFLTKFVRQSAATRGSAPDLILLDPPRAGAGGEVCALLSACSPRRIVYVSCDPATLGRDLTLLIQSGYRLHRLQLVDMFPQTGHLETIAMLDR